MDELVVDGEKYISSKRAARVSGYAKDYIGQLCRAGKIEAKMVGRSWYVKESAIKEHRKTFQGEPVVDDKLWVEGKNGLEFKGFGASAASPPQRHRLDEDNIAIHYESDPRPLMPIVERKGSSMEASSSAPEARADEAMREESDVPERHQTEETFESAHAALHAHREGRRLRNAEAHTLPEDVFPLRTGTHVRRGLLFLVFLGVAMAFLILMLQSRTVYRSTGEGSFSRESNISWGSITESVGELVTGRRGQKP